MMRGAERLHGASIPAPEENVPTRESGRFGAALRVFAGLLLVIGASVGVAVSAHRYALTSPRFAVRHIEVRGGQRIGSDEVRTLAGISPGANMFALDSADVERRLLENPYIAKVRVARKLPGTLEVELTERSAEALTAIADRLYLVSGEGEPFKAVEPSDPIDLPVITGLDADALSRDRRRELERLMVGLEVLRQYARLSMSRAYAAQEVNVSESGEVTLTVGREGVALALGKGPFRQRLSMAERVVNEMRRSGRLPGVVFADNAAHPERVVVRLR